MVTPFRVGKIQSYVPRKRLKYFCTTIEPGAYLVDAFPFLRHLLAWFQGLQKHGMDWSLMLSEAPFKYVQGAKTDATRGCVVAEALEEETLEENGALPEVDELIEWSSDSGGHGIDTTSSVLASFLLAMTTSPGCMQESSGRTFVNARKWGLTDHKPPYHSC
ncbi:hypothetical protein BDM02DRAFT_2140665 [Thelephora ganbajun]|uniref:Uncharacterized protein n=1 Tax=Thelephora ganbajun TaxID=370292 RepID=A0ACB6ZTD1_THEGA|nr:hypothetical protein BDM02DRAFT_2140665 [Thelephora ganbajun]